MTWGEWGRTAMANTSGDILGTSSVLHRKRGGEVQWMTSRYANALEACAEALQNVVMPTKQTDGVSEFPRDYVTLTIPQSRISQAHVALAALDTVRQAGQG